MLLILDSKILFLFITACFLPLTQLNLRIRSIYITVMLLILCRLIPVSSSVFSLAPIVAVRRFSFWILSLSHRFVPYKISHTYYIPSRVPYPLIPLLYALEIISDLIRPFALVVRIVVNLSLRHLFIHRSAGPILGIVLPLILIFELGVAFIQRYIYTSLPSLWV